MSQSKILLSVCLLLMAVAGVAYAQVYKWVDENGVTRYSNVAPPEHVEDVHTAIEAKGAPEIAQETEELEDVLESYREDELEYYENEKARKRKIREQRIEDRDRKVAESMKKHHEERAEYYKKKLGSAKKELKSLQRHINQQKRRSYTDARRHQRTLQTLEGKADWLKDKIVEYEQEYEDHKRRSR